MPDKEGLKRAFTAVTLLYSCWLALITGYVFFSAYFTPEQAVRVSVNDFGEANIEFLVLLFVLPGIVYNTCRLYIKAYKGEL